MSAEWLQLIVDDEGAGTRLDRFVAQQLPDLSRSYAQQLIDDSHVLVNGQDARASYSLRPGDTVAVFRPPPQPTDLVAEPIPLRVVYEDDDVVVIDKPAGLVVHPAPGHPSGTLVNALLSRYPDLAINGDIRPGIVHRIDRDTSGLLVVARNERALADLQDQQQRHAMHKVYLALVEGRFKEPAGVIDAPIGRSLRDRKLMAIVPDGRSARTHWRVLEELGDYQLVEATLETGRTHQIRVHFAAKNRPIVGDPHYGARRRRPTLGLERQFLHAYRLGFRLPASGEWREFESPLPDDLAAVLEKLRRQAQA